MAIRSAVHRAGAAALTELLRHHPPPREQRAVPCPCGQRARYRELRRKQILTAIGPVHLQRPYYVCAHCHKGQFPLDAQLDVEDTAFSPGVRRMLARVGHDGPFDQGRQHLELLADLTVTTNAVERTAEAIGQDMAAQEEKQMNRAGLANLPGRPGPPIPLLHVQFDGTGAPMVRSETEGRASKVEGQPAHTREAKLGCVFTQTTLDEKGRPVRDEASTTYTGAIETAEPFGRRLYAEACHRGWDRAEKKVIIGDGAPWIWNLAQLHFPGAIEIVDLYHARQHLWQLAALLYPNDSTRQKRCLLAQQHQLDHGQIERLVASLRSLHPTPPLLADRVRTEADYFEKNARRMRYPTFRAQHLLVGSGVIEAGCKTVIGARLKASGMFWTLRGTNAIIALRCCQLSGRFEDYWEARSA